MTDPDPIRYRELARQAVDLQRKHAPVQRKHGTEVSAALAPIRDATGADDATLLPVLQDAADAPDDAGALAVLKAAAAPAPLLPEPLTADGWNAAPPPRHWLVDGWLPAGELALLTGPGSVGKSLIALQLGVALACDRDALQNAGGWLPKGSAVTSTAPELCDEPCSVVLAGWEDSADEALRRRGRLAMPGGCGWARDRSINRRLHVLPMRGFGPLWAPADSGSRHIATVGALTPGGSELLGYAEAQRARLLVIDPAGLAICTNENDRALVSMALDALAGWALRSGCTLMITGHPAKATEGEAADYSGSTAWRGSVRSMWTLKQPQHADRDSAEWRSLTGRDPNRAERVANLTRNKNNYGWDGDALTVATTGGRAGWYLTNPVPAQPKRKPSKAKTAANGAGKVAGV